jgi:hypothetical protein
VGSRARACSRYATPLSASTRPANISRRGPGARPSAGTNRS